MITPYQRLLMEEFDRDRDWRRETIDLLEALRFARQLPMEIEEPHRAEAIRFYGYDPFPSELEQQRREIEDRCRRQQQRLGLIHQIGNAFLWLACGSSIAVIMGGNLAAFWGTVVFGSLAMFSFLGEFALIGYWTKQWHKN